MSPTEARCFRYNAVSRSSLLVLQREHVHRRNPTEYKKVLLASRAYAKSKIAQRSSITPLEVYVRLVHIAKEKVVTLTKQFKPAFGKANSITSENFTILTGLSLSTKPLYVYNHLHIKEAGVNKLFKSLDQSKALDPDDLSPKLPEPLVDEIAQALTAVFQSIVDIDRNPTGYLLEQGLLSNVFDVCKATLTDSTYSLHLF